MIEKVKCHHDCFHEFSTRVWFLKQGSSDQVLEEHCSNPDQTHTPAIFYWFWRPWEAQECLTRARFEEPWIFMDHLRRDRSQNKQTQSEGFRFILVEIWDKNSQTERLTWTTAVFQLWFLQIFFYQEIKPQRGSAVSHQPITLQPRLWAATSLQQVLTRRALTEYVLYSLITLRVNVIIIVHHVTYGVITTT